MIKLDCIRPLRCTSIFVWIVSLTLISGCGGCGKNTTCELTKPDPDAPSHKCFEEVTKDECDEIGSFGALIGAETEYGAGSSCDEIGYPNECVDQWELSSGEYLNTHAADTDARTFMGRTVSNDCDFTVPAGAGNNDVVDDNNDPDPNNNPNGGTNSVVQGDCWAKFSGTNTSYMDVEVIVLKELPAGLTFKASYAPNSGSQTAGCPSSPGLQTSSAPMTAWSGMLKFGVESDEQCNPTITDPSNGAAFDLYQLWFLNEGGGEGPDFGTVELQKGVAIVADSGTVVEEIWIPAQDAAFNCVYR